MEKEKANQLLKFLQERSTVPIEVNINALDDQDFPKIFIRGGDYVVKFGFLKNGKVTVRSKFMDADSTSLKNWIKAIKTTMLNLGIQHIKGSDTKKLQVACFYDERVLPLRQNHNQRFPYLEMPGYCNVSNSMVLSEDTATDLLKNYLGGGY